MAFSLNESIPLSHVGPKLSASAILKPAIEIADALDARKEKKNTQAKRDAVLKIFDNAPVDPVTGDLDHEKIYRSILPLDPDAAQHYKTTIQTSLIQKAQEARAAAKAVQDQELNAQAITQGATNLAGDEAVKQELGNLLTPKTNILQPNPEQSVNAPGYQPYDINKLGNQPGAMDLLAPSPESQQPSQMVTMSKPVESLTLETLLGNPVIAQHANHPAVQEIAKMLKPASAGGMGNVFMLKKKEIDDIYSMPEGPEKELAKEKYLMNTASSSYYGLTPEGISKATQKAGSVAAAGATGRIAGETNAGGGINPVVTDRTTKLRDEFSQLPEIKSIKTLYSNYTKANQVYKNYKDGKATPYEVDQSLGYFASKALDPNSVVMPGEFDRFAKGIGVAEGASALANQLITGGLKLTDTQREAMINIINNAYTGGSVSAKRQYDYYTDLAKQNGAKPDQVVGSADYLFPETKKIKKVFNEQTRKFDIVQ